MSYKFRYLSVLVELTKVEGTRHGATIAGQLLDVAVRVPSVRHFAVGQTALLLENSHLLLTGNVQHRHNICEVLYAAAWICGEYSEHVRTPQIVLESMLRAKLSLLPGHIQSAFVQNIAKLYARMLYDAEKDEDWDKISTLDNLMLSKLPIFEQTDCLEAQERACSINQLAREVDKFHKQGVKVASDLIQLFDGELGPVAAKAQRKVPVPPDLDLNSWINEPSPEQSPLQSDDDGETPTAKVDGGRPTSSMNVGGGVRSIVVDQPRKSQEPSATELKKIREARKAELENNPHYLKSSSKMMTSSVGGGVSSSSSNKSLSKSSSVTSATLTSGDGVGQNRSISDQFNKIPEITAIDLQSPLDIPGMVGLDKYLEQQSKTLDWKNAKKKGKKNAKQRKKNSSSDDDDSTAAAAPSSDSPVVAFDARVNRGVGEMPENAKSTDDDEADGGGDRTVPRKRLLDPYKALNIDLDEPLRPDERLPVLHHRATPPLSKSSSTLEVKPKSKKPSEEKIKKTKKDTTKMKKKKSKKSKHVEEIAAGGTLLLLEENSNGKRCGYEETSGVSTPTVLL